jgi:hypothetical protein
MSTAFRVRPALPWGKLFSDLPKGVTECIGPDTKEDKRCLTNGDGYIWAYRNDDGSDTTFERFGLQGIAPYDVLEAIAEKFGVTVFSEHDDGFWDPEDEIGGGLDTFAEEWASIVGEEGETKAREGFLALVKKARGLGMETTATYPDGKPLEL